MIAKTEFGHHLKTILREMSHRVGLAISEGAFDFFKKDKWFWEYEWSKAEQSDFTNWLTDYLFNNKEARSELMSSVYRNKKSCRKAAEEFVWNYGWKVKE